MTLYLKKIFSLVFILTLFTPLYSQEEFQNSMIVPIAYGDVAVDEISDDEFLIEIEIDNLTDPENIDESSGYYAVWAESRKDTSLLGILDLDDDMNGHFITQASLEDEPEYILISAEETNFPSRTSELVVLRSQEFEF